MIHMCWREVCGACGGSGFQHNQLTGMNEKCPVCYGAGSINKSNYDSLPDGVYL